VATVTKGRIRIGLQSMGGGSPFAALKGADNRDPPHGGPRPAAAT